MAQNAGMPRIKAASRKIHFSSRIFKTSVQNSQNVVIYANLLSCQTYENIEHCVSYEAKYRCLFILNTL